ncbi:PAS domain-containing protein [Baaleninema simplex]|uniref:PAS domain-containing protein n=1 Tax=Baaleninema simplex TaxID=2862350 RepID=UPI0003448F04|nr:PAS domain-containing protein [Baaleninema simplex]
MSSSHSLPFDASSSPGDRFAVVGIGASAGGLSALGAFFKNVPPDSELAFVVVQHLAANFESALPLLIQNQTQLAVRVVRDGLAIEPNTIYVIPPRARLVARQQRLYLFEPQLETSGLDFPIDRFFGSLANDMGARAIGIVLSGTGSDGTLGLQAIREAGGLTFAQSPASAEFSGMPESAIDSGVVDLVLSPEELARTLVRSLQQNNSPLRSSTESWCSNLSDDLSLPLDDIIESLSEDDSLDFSHYKTGTLTRRIQRRLLLSDCSDIRAYLDYLKNSPTERQRLRRDLLVSVTSFFRDVETWQVLETKVLPPLLERLTRGQQLRAWVTACATGEEAYSMAMVLDEARRRANRRLDVKIFATDIDAIALERASLGIYPETLADRISPERLDRYFTVRDGQLQVRRELRDLLVFSPHNLIKNVGFSRMHVVSCRNVLIYMQPHLQQQVLRTLHFSLVHQGVLFLGSSETLGNLDGEFESLDSATKLFRKRRDVRLNLSPRNLEPLQHRALHRPPAEMKTPRFDPILQAAFETLVADRNATCFVVGSGDRLLHVFGDGLQLLQVPKGAFKIDTMLPQALHLPLKAALQRARREQKTVRYRGIRWQQEGETVVNLNLNAAYCPANSPVEECFAISISADGSPEIGRPKALEFETDAEAAQRVLELETELQNIRENLQQTIEELEVSNEEQQATNEELLASNEELQSTNEELQSVNEELHTLNAEYQSKIRELAALNEDTNNFIDSTQIGVIFVDRTLRVRKFTPAVTNAVPLVESDIGRPLQHFSNNLDVPDLLDRLTEVTDNGGEFSQEVYNRETQSWFLLRVNPFRRRDGSFDGLVLSLVDVNPLKHAQEEIARKNAELSYLYSTLPVGLALVDENLVFLKINDILAEINGLTARDHIGKTVREILPELAEELEQLYQRVLATREPIRNLEVGGITPADPQRLRTWLISYNPLELPDGKLAVSSVVTDITELKAAQQAVEDREAHYRFVTDNIQEAIFQTDDRGRLTFLNAAWTRLFGFAIADSLGRPLEAFLHPDDREPFEALRQAVFSDGGDERIVEIRLVTRSREIRWLEVWLRELRDGQRGTVKLFGTLNDISDRKAAEWEFERLNHELEDRVEERTRELQASREALERQESEFRRLLANTPDIISRFDRQLRYRYTNATIPPRTDEPTKLVGRTLAETGVSTEYADTCEAAMRQVLETGEAVKVEEYFSEDDRWYEIRVIPEFDGTSEVVTLLKIVRDVTAAKRAETELRSSEEKFRQLTEHIEEVFYLTDLETHEVLYVSPAYEQIWGISRERLYDRSLSWLDPIHPSDRDGVASAWKVFFEGRGAYNIEYRILRGENEIRWIRDTAFLIRDRTDRPYRIAGLAEDITERHNYEARIQASLQEKEVLLREIHHRVKNNLNVVHSLLAMQARQVGDKRMKSLLLESQSRLRTMALIHEHLYRSESLSKIDFSNYLRSAIGHLSDLFELHRQPIEVRIEAEAIELSIETAIPCGLIVNELLSNAIEHAFPDGNGGEIWVTLRERDNTTVEVAVCDNGVGIPKEYLQGRPKSMGLKLVNILVDQLDATFECEVANGTNCRIAIVRSMD